MNIGALLGRGIAIYATLYLVWSGLVIHGLSGTLIARIIVFVSLITIVVVATRSLRLSTERDIAPYAIGWVLVAAALDAVFAVPSSGWGIYTDWNLWVGYALLFIVPLIVIAISRKKTVA